MFNPEYLGFIAGFLTTAAAFPQLLKVLHSKHTVSISLWMYIFLNTGIFLWMIYGVFIHSQSLIVTNLIALSINLSILGLKLRHG